MTVKRFSMVLSWLALASAGWAAVTFAASPEETARAILEESGCRGGLVLHVGCGDGQVTAALRGDERFLVHGLDADPTNVERARDHVRSQGLYGPVWVEHWTSDRLPYAENMVNLLVVDPSGVAPPEEIMRVLVPGGVAYIRGGGESMKLVKPWPQEIDEWTHWLHGPDGNAVARDQVVGPPRRLQWAAKPLWSRHHDTVPSVSAMVSARGRLFYIVDEAPASISGDTPDRWSLVARDAFNGVQLWRIPISDWGWNAWSSFWKGRFNQPNQIPKRLVAVGDRVYVTLGFNAPLTALDAASGKIIRTYEGTEFTDEILCQDGTLILSVNESAQQAGTIEENPPVKKSVVAVRAETGEVLWKTGRYTGVSTKTGPVQRVTHLLLTACGPRVFLVDQESLVAVDLESGTELWRSPRPEVRLYTSRYEHCMSEMSTLVATEDRVFFCQLEPIQQRIGWRVIKARLQAYSAKTGEILWDYPCGNWGHFCVPDVFLARGLVWVHHNELTTMVGLDPATGEEKQRLSTTVAFDSGHHHRCYRNKATERFMITSYRGLEFLDWEGTDTLRNHWVRGTCRFGIVPCNGLIYATPHPCDCYITSKLNGLLALAPQGKGREVRDEGREIRDEGREIRDEGREIRDEGREIRDEGRGVRDEATRRTRLQRGPAYTEIINLKSEIINPKSEIITPSDWPTYRHDPQRSGTTPLSLSADVKPAWQADLDGKPTASVAVGDTVFVASATSHEVIALDARDGKRLWAFTPGGSVDTPPTISGGCAYFGCTDGYVYCLRASDGALAWRFHGAPAHRLVGAYGGVQSAWPIHGSALVDDGVVYFTAGRSSFLDGGIAACSLDARTGRLLSHRRLTTSYAMKVDMGRNQRDNTGMLSDLLVSHAGSIYMRQHRLFPAGEQEVPGGPLRCTAGLLDDSWFSRTRWHLDDRPYAEYLIFDAASIYGVRARNAMSGTGGFFTPAAEGYELLAIDADRPSGKSTSQQPAASRGKKTLKKRWSIRVPVRITSMVLAGETLFAAGHPDVLDPNEPWAAYEGKRGGLLLVLSAADGRVLAEHRLDAPPVLDGLAAARGRLLISTINGKVLCYQ